LTFQGCGSFPTIKPIEAGAINYPKDYYRVATFDFNYGKLLCTSEASNRPLSQAHKWIAISAEDWMAIQNYLDAIYTYMNKNFKAAMPQLPKSRGTPKNKGINSLINSDF
jgi:hypothetical protein